MAVVKERSLLRAAGALVFRILELSAHALLPAVMSWLVEPSAIGILFVLLWYLPASRHVGSYKKPLAFPLLAFVVDDFSLLGLHPTPRNAKGMYRIMAIRVLLLLLLLPMSEPAISPLPASVRLIFFRQGVWDIVTRHVSLGFTGLASLWMALFVTVVLQSVLWLIITVHMLTVGECGGRRSPIQGEVSRDLAKVQEIAAKVDATRVLGDEECHQALVRLKQTYPDFMLTNVFNTFGPAVGFVSRLLSEVYSIALFVFAAYRQRGDANMAMRHAILALILGATLYVTLVQLGQQRPDRVVGEAWRSWVRGVHTEGYLAIVRADKGAQAIPALFVKIYGLPYAATTSFSVLVSWGSILGVIGVVSFFIFQQFDLGVEEVGADSKLLSLELGAALEATPWCGDEQWKARDRKV